MIQGSGYRGLGMRCRGSDEAGACCSRVQLSWFRIYEFEGSCDMVQDTWFRIRGSGYRGLDIRGRSPAS